MQRLTLRWEADGQPRSKSIGETESLLIGRSEACDVQIKEPTVSREHASIYAEGEAFYLKNLSTRNSILMNDESRLAPDKILPMRSGTRFKLGSVEVEVASIEEHPEPEIKVKCPTCGRRLEPDLKDCPWDGTSLASAETVFD